MNSTLTQKCALTQLTCISPGDVH